MSGTERKTPINTFGRVLLWFGSLLAAVGLFSFLFSRGESAESAAFIFGVTMTFVLPVAFLYLPVVVLLKDAEGRRGWVHLVTGALIGPTCLTLWGFILQLRGEDAHVVWQGDGEAPGTLACMILAVIVGFLTTGLYVVGLKIFIRKTS